MLHTGEGDIGTGEVNRRPGRYRSDCCRAEHQAPGREVMPPCSRCGHPADWTWIGSLGVHPKSDIPACAASVAAGRRHPTLP